MVRRSVQETIDLFEGRDGWDKGWDVGDLAIELYGEDSPETRLKAKMRLRAARRYFASQGKLLTSVHRGRKYRYCLVKDKDEAFTTQNMLLLLIRGNAERYREQDIIIQPMLPAAERRQLLDACFNIMRRLTMPAEEQKPEKQKQKVKRSKSKKEE
ncbi:hypothetical protein M1N59_00880 [Dehalococcoidales bacterium]|nr:hypothetical protein [Dehalococcoidales bacterium]